MFARLLRRARSALATWPTARGWVLATLLGAAALALELSIGLAGGFLRPAPGDWSILPGTLLLALFVPAIGEELVFRGVLTPGREEQPALWRAILPSTLLFVLWHVLEALTFMPDAAVIFLRPDFLATTAVLGLTCGVLRHRTGSLWPAVALHWVEVAGWQVWFGGGEIAKALG
ncbi:CPBP family glutamic-type intramembrane protease [Caulobacter mirabilis]|uniref:CPBP family intramembrane metalloprotease n=1 Tax=Caulobacter mirabilis TaxID=69666 RepID=A0A2D2AT45_9CAUL|nr:CPBP family glutamic-type intramembrane protease [Caulobacter mirabilis]ATQ41171.1 CPBP family intramembrane metalloprotease [Caulobacter mirabilis]